MPRPSHHSSPPPRPQSLHLFTDAWQAEVVPRLPPDLTAQAVAHHAFHRQRLLAQPTDLLRGLLAYACCCSSFRALGAWALLVGLGALSDTAWRKRLRAANDWLLWLLADLLAAPPLPASVLPAPGRVLLVDATRLRQPGGCGDDWRLHTAYDLRQGRLAQVHLTDRSGGETLARYTLQPRDILVCDSGYGHRGSVAAVQAQHADLVMRICPSQFPCCTAAGDRFDLIAKLRQRGPVLRSYAVWCTHAQQRYPVRVVVVKLPADVACTNRRRILQRWKQKGHKINPLTIFLAGFVLLVTTLARTAWPDEAVARLYRARWQIELVFKRMKAGLAVGQVRSRTRATVEATVRALLVGWALQEGVAQEVRQALVAVGRGLAQAVTGGAPVVSSWLLTTLSLETLRHQIRGAWTQARIQTCLPLLVRYLCRPLRGRGHQETTIRAWLEERVTESRARLRQAA